MKSQIAQIMVENDKWLRSKGVVMDDVVVDTLPNPKVKINGRSLVSFSSNNYLGLSQRKEVKDSAIKALKKYGYGTCESRRLGGDLKILEDLEKAIADFKGTEDSIIFATGLMANMGAIPAILDSDFYVNKFFNKSSKDKKIVVLGDQLNHRSIQLGIKLSHADFFKYKHCDMVELEKLLVKNKKHPTLIVTDGVFSMDGDMAPLDKIVSLSQKYNAGIYIDDAHSTGVYGLNGKGTAEHFGIKNENVEFQMGTLSKAFGALGGYVAGKKSIIDMLKLSAPTYYFTSSLPAEQAAGLITTINLIKKEPHLRKKLWNNVNYVLESLRRLELDFPLQWSQIIPVIVGDEKKTLELEKYLLKKGIQCSGVTPPAVATGKSRLRVSINATHTKKDIDLLMNVLEDSKKKFKLPEVKLVSHEVEDFVKNTPSYIKSFIDR